MKKGKKDLTFPGRDLNPWILNKICSIQVNPRQISCNIFGALYFGTAFDTDVKSKQNIFSNFLAFSHYI